MNSKSAIRLAAAAAAGMLGAHSAMAADCSGLPNHQQLKAALSAAVAAESSGLDFQMWATVINRDGEVCAVAFSGAHRGSQWPGSRVISAQKANTANAFGLDGLALSTANLFSAVQPGGSLYGLQHSNPVHASVAYAGNPAQYGTAGDAMVGKKVGGVNVFGGGLGLYNASRQIVGAVGVSGDTSCADHMIAWRVRSNLLLDFVSSGPAALFAGDAAHPDNIIYDIAAAGSATGFGHPTCLNTGDPSGLPAVR